MLGKDSKKKKKLVENSTTARPDFPLRKKQINLVQILCLLKYKKLKKANKDMQHYCIAIPSYFAASAQNLCLFNSEAPL